MIVPLRSDPRSLQDGSSTDGERPSRTIHPLNYLMIAPEHLFERLPTRPAQTSFLDER